MTTITIYDPAMCCTTGICGAEVDQRLVDLAADLDWLKTRGVTVTRFGLSRDPAEFAANEIVRRIMQESEGDDLPVFLVDGELKARARYPGRAELAGWVGLDAQATPSPEAPTGCCSSVAEEAPEASGCCGGSRADRREKAGAAGCC